MQKNSTLTSQICVNYSTKPSYTICSGTFFHFTLCMHAEKIYRMSTHTKNQEKICSVIDKNLHRYSQ